MINLNYPAILDLFPQHLDPKRSESAAFLIWYLENYCRFDEQEAVDSVCDQSGDKGVDGITVNDNDQTITVFQSRISQSSTTTIGDASLRTFAGTLAQFGDSNKIEKLIQSAGTARIAALAKELDLVNKINTHELRGEFLSNIDLDENGARFLDGQPHITSVGKSRLEATYISDSRDVVEHSSITFDIVGFPVMEYIVDNDTKAVIAPIKASELVALNGIADQSLFAYNVRGSLGNTQVNRDIVKSIRDPAIHKLFPLFHNGITVIVRQLSRDAANLTATGCFVVNGCQSLTALFDNRGKLTANLRIPTKFIQLDPTSALARDITHFSNNQNGVKARDFMSNNATQIRLQNDFRKHYDSQYAFDIKRGETPGRGVTISNEDAGRYLMAFDLKEPWATHRKYQVFEEKHAALFGRPEVTADRIVMCQVIIEAVDNKLPGIENKLLAKYKLTRYLLVYLVRVILEQDGLRSDLLTKPEQFVRKPDARKRFRECVERIVEDAFIDLNAEVQEYGDTFDYRGRLRDSEWAKELTKKVVTDYLKLVKRGRIHAFKDEWESSAKVQTTRAPLPK